MTLWRPSVVESVWSLINCAQPNPHTQSYNNGRRVASRFAVVPVRVCEKYCKPVAEMLSQCVCVRAYIKSRFHSSLTHSQTYGGLVCVCVFQHTAVRECRSITSALLKFVCACVCMWGKRALAQMIGEILVIAFDSRRVRAYSYRRRRRRRLAILLLTKQRRRRLVCICVCGFHHNFGLGVGARSVSKHTHTLTQSPLAAAKWADHVDVFFFVCRQCKYDNWLYWSHAN